MTDQYVIILAIELLTGFLAALTALLLWSKTRDTAWLLMVLGVVFLYLKSLVKVLYEFGFVIYERYYLYNIDVVELSLNILPFIFFFFGLITFLFRIRKH